MKNNGTKNSQKIYSFNIELAEKYGVNGAIILQHLIYWISHNKKRKSAAHFRDNKYWSYLSYYDFSKTFPFWTERQIRTNMNKLINEGAVIKGPYGRKLYYKANWYSVNEELMKTLNYLMSKRKKRPVSELDDNLT